MKNLVLFLLINLVSLSISQADDQFCGYLEKIVITDHFSYRFSEMTLLNNINDVSLIKIKDENFILKMIDYVEGEFWEPTRFYEFLGREDVKYFICVDFYDLKKRENEYQVDEVLNYKIYDIKL